MSDYPPPTPPPPPRPPLAVLPAAAGAAIGYGQTAARRPGILTAVGVVSIVVACLSMAASYGTGYAGVAVQRLSTIFKPRLTPVRPSVPAPVVPATPSSADPVGVWARGLEAADRRTVAEALGQIESLSPAHRRQLDRILARAGQEMFTGTGADLTTAGVRAAVRGHGTLPSDDPKDPDPAYFDTATGRLQLHGDRAFFKSYDQSVTVRSNAEDDDTPPPAADPGATAVPPGTPDGSKKVDPFASDDDAPAAPAPPGGAAVSPAAVGSPAALSPMQVQSIVQKVQVAAGNRLNPAQLAGIQAALQGPNQQLVPPGAAWSPVNFAQVQADGSAVVKLSGGYLFIDSQGSVQNPATVTPSVPNIPTLTPVVLIAEAAGSFALAILLLVSGIIVLRQGRRGGRLLLIYALLKIPLAAVGGGGVGWLIYAFASSVGSSGRSDAAAGAAVWGIGLGLVSLAFPVALLIVLRTRTVRDYYRAVA